MGNQGRTRRAKREIRRSDVTGEGGKERRGDGESERGEKAGKEAQSETSA